MAIRNIDALNKKIEDKKQEAINAAQLRREKVKMYYTSIMNNINDIQDAIDTAEYLHEKKVRIPDHAIHFVWEDTKIVGLRFGDMTIYPSKQTIRIISYCYGMSEGYDIVPPFNNDYTNQQITSDRSPLGMEPYPVRLDRYVAMLPTKLNDFFDKIYSM